MAAQSKSAELTVQSIFKNILRILTKKEKRSLSWLFGLLTMTSVIDLMGMTSIIPFISLLSNPDYINEHEILILLYDYFQFENHKFFLSFLGFSVAIFIVACSAIKILSVYLMFKFSFMREHSISMRLLKAYMYRPFAWHLSQQRTDLSKTILTDANTVTHNAVLPFLVFFTQAVMTFCILAILLWVNFEVAIFVMSTLLGSYAVIYIISRKKLSSIGHIREASNQARFKSVSNILNGIMEIKIHEKNSFYLKFYEDPSHTYSENQATGQIIASLPRYILETISIVGLLATMSLLILRKQDSDSVLATMVLYAVAGYRLLPALQTMYQSVSVMRVISPTLENLANNIVSSENQSTLNAENMIDVDTMQTLELRQVCFKHKGAEKNQLEKINLKISHGSFISIIGESGSGKSTLVALLTGLLKPTSGCLLLNGKKLEHDNYNLTSPKIGFVSQKYYLLNATILNNIAFGVSEEDLDLERVRSVLEVVNLDDLVFEQLTDGLSTMIGDGGIQLSGGQLQRIGIARALYAIPEILILDEATSALDARTEAKLLNNIKEFCVDCTIIMITHKLEITKETNNIVMLKDGKLAGYGTFPELSNADPYFKSLLNGDR